MKIYRTVSFFALVTLSSVAFAACPKDSALAQTDAILDFCARTDPAVAPQALAFKRLLVAGVPQKDLNDVLESSGFKQSYDTVQDQLKTLPKGQALAACSSLGTATSQPGKK